MKKRSTLIIIMLAVSLIGCGNASKTNDTVEETTTYTVESEENTSEITDETVEETAETAETEAERKEQETIKALQEKYNSDETVDITSTSGKSLSLKVNNMYTSTVLNEVNENTKVETIAEFKSIPKDNLRYNVKVYEVPLESKDFLVENPLRLEDSDNESTNTFIDLICVDNKESDVPLKVLDSDGKEHIVKKFEISLDLTILNIDELSLCRETPTYYAIENGESYIALLFTEETVTDEEIQVEQEQAEETSNAQFRSAGSDPFESLNDNVIIEDTKTEEEIQIEKDKHKEEVNSIYEGLDDKTKEYIQTIRDEFQKKELESEDVRVKRLEEIDKIAFDFINNIMIGKFE